MSKELQMNAACKAIDNACTFLLGVTGGSNCEEPVAQRSFQVQRALVLDQLENLILI